MIKLSDAIQPLSRSVTQFVHGVAKPFLETGERLAASRGKQLPGATASSPNLLPPATANGVVNGVETGDHGAAQRLWKCPERGSDSSGAFQLTATAGDRAQTESL